MQPVHVSLGWNQLHVHPLSANPLADRRDGPVCHQRVLRLPALLGHPPRAVRRSPSKRLPGGSSC